MKFKNGKELMNLPNFIKVGCEIEAQNCNFEVIKQIIESTPNLKGWKVKKDRSVTDNGIEVVSPPLNELDNPNVYEEIETVLNIIKNNPKDKNRRVYVNEQCGGHIHFDAEMMLRNTEMVESFLRLWKESEEIIYKMCNAENDIIREEALKLTPVDGIKRILFANMSEIMKTIDVSKKEEIIRKIPEAIKEGTKKRIQGVFRVSASILKPNGFAHPIGKELNKVGNKREYIEKVLECKNGKKIKFNKKLKSLTNHETGINMQHLTKKGLMDKGNDLLEGKKDINTYEFRMHNSSLDIDIWKQNILLDAAFSKIAYEMAYEPEKNSKKLSEFFEKDITESQKVDRFLELLFDNDDDKRIYKARWESVKDEHTYKQTKGFNKACFTREDVKQVTLNTLSKDVVSYMKVFLEKAKEFIRDESSSINIDREAFFIDYGGRDDL